MPCATAVRDRRAWPPSRRYAARLAQREETRGALLVLHALMQAQLGQLRGPGADSSGLTPSLLAQRSRQVATTWAEVRPLAADARCEARRPKTLDGPAIGVC